MLFTGLGGKAKKSTHLGQALAVPGSYGQGLVFCAAGDFPGSPLDGQYLQPGCSSALWPKHTQHREVWAYGPGGLPRVSSASQGKADNTWNSNRSQRHTEKLFVFFSEMQIQLGVLHFTWE